jgi:hypothetical protein
MADLTIRCCPVCPEKRIVASRVATRLKREDAVTVDRVTGGLGEFTVLFNGQTIFQSKPYWFTSTKKVLECVRTVLSSRETANNL